MPPGLSMNRRSSARRSRLQVDQSYQAADRRLDHFFELKQKNGPKPICEKPTTYAEPSALKAFEV
jgi:hypothetical protein